MSENSIALQRNQLPHVWYTGGMRLAVSILLSDTTAVASNRNEAGQQIEYWDGRNERGEKVSSGVYFYRLTIGDYKSTKKMLMLK